MRSCSRCGKTEKEALLYEVLLNKGLSVMCEDCVNLENPMILKKPSEDNAIRFALGQKIKRGNRDDYIENFHWQIRMARRRTKLSQKQLSQELNTSEEEIAKLEAGEVPENDVLIKRMEKFFSIKLTKSPGPSVKPVDLLGDVDIVEESSNPDGIFKEKI